jgi:hypothetical protein
MVMRLRRMVDLIRCTFSGILLWVNCWSGKKDSLYEITRHNWLWGD